MTAPARPMTAMDGSDDGPLDPAIQAAMRDLFGADAQVGPTADTSRTNEVMAPNPPEEDEAPPVDALCRLMEALYGSTFPLINALMIYASDHPDAESAMPPLEVLLPLTEPDEWALWARDRWGAHGPAVEMHLHLIARNRLFRSGQQWVSSRGRDPWKEPPRPAESARVTDNQIAPALDQRLQIITDQRPGFNIDPETMSPDSKRKALARQIALEYQFDVQGMALQIHDAAFWAGTDGVAFWHTYWDRDAGPWSAQMNKPKGPYAWDAATEMWIHAETGAPKEMPPKPMGELATKTLRVEQVRVSANATLTEAPYEVIIRDVIPESQSAGIYGLSGLQNRANRGDISGHGDSQSSGSNSDGMIPSWVLTQTTVGEGNRMNNVPTVERYFVYVDKQSDVLPAGLQLTVIGNSVAWGPGELLFRMIPVVDVRDGSTDTSYLPRPIMEQWIPPQMRLNSAKSLWTNNIRVNAGGRVAAKPDAVSRETFVGAGLSVLEIEGPGAIRDNLMPIEGFSVGADTTNYVEAELKTLENLTGNNDVSRGQISGDASGRAILAAREQLERIFTPPVQAMARALSQWGKIQVAGMAWGYDIPRDVGAIGTDRPDLARALSSQDFDGPCTVKVEPDTLMPMPRAFRMMLLDDWLNRGLITPQQYMRNVTFANFRSLSTPDEDQEARAKRIVDALRQGQQVPQGDPTQPLAMRWTDNEAIFQDVLEREILLQDDLDPQIIASAQAVWTAYATQSQTKSGGSAPGAPPPSSPGTGPTSARPSLFTPPPTSAPLTSSNPSVTAGIQPTIQDSAATQFEQASPQ